MVLNYDKEHRGLDEDNRGLDIEYRAFGEGGCTMKDKVTTRISMRV